MLVKFKNSLDEYFDEQIAQKFPGFKEMDCQVCDAKAKRVDRDHFKCVECGEVIRLEITGKQ